MAVDMDKNNNPIFDALRDFIKNGHLF